MSLQSLKPFLAILMLSRSDPRALYKSTVFDVDRGRVFWMVDSRIDLISIFLLKFILFLNYVHMCMIVYGFGHICSGSLRGQKRASDPMELQLQ